MSSVLDRSSSYCAYESAACRVWTGERGVPLDRVLNADVEELDAIHGRIRIWLKQEQPQRGVFLVPNSARRKQRVSGSTGARSDGVSVFLSSECFQSFAVYSPSPLSSSVLVLIDVGETQQQCYFFGKAQRCIDLLHANDQERPGEEAWSFVRNVDFVTELLADLHKSFPEVPLSPSARELLSSAALGSSSKITTAATTKKPIPQRQGRPGSSVILKRRRTLSATNFYGNNPKPSTPATTISQSSTSNSSTPLESESGWRSFYEKLQFRVSHSLMCQLEGTAPVSSTFPRQQEAFEFVDQIRAFRQQMMRDRSSKIDSDSDIKTSSSLEFPRVFSFEDAREGKRRFLVSNSAIFWENYVNTHPAQRHVYEIIREGVPCRLYFDLEFKKSCNPNVDGDQLVTRLISLLQLQLFRKYQIYAPRDQIVHLDSSTSAKFSRHLIFHFPNGELFEDNIHAGNFVREFIHDLVENTNEADDQDSPFLVNSGRQQQPQDDDQQSTNSNNNNCADKQLFIDTGVYTRNRMFRVLGSSKYRRDAILQYISPTKESNQQQQHTNGIEDAQLDRELFFRALVCPCPTREALMTSSYKTVRLLRCDQDAPALKRSSDGRQSLWAMNAGGGHHHPSRLSSARSVECRQSMFPKLDAFILSKASIGGIHGEIRAIQMLFNDVAVVLPTTTTPVTPDSGDNVDIDSTISRIDEQDLNKNNQEQAQSYAPIQIPRRPWMLIYQMARNRWCWNVRRAHKSNNVMLIVDLDQRVFYQKCHDQGCKAIDYRSPSLPLPPDLMDE